MCQKQASWVTGCCSLVHLSHPHTLAMTSSDVRAILNLPQTAGASTVASRKASQLPKKPDGISRELYALIGDNAPSLAEAQASLAATKNKFKPKLKGKKVQWYVVPPGMHALLRLIGNGPRSVPPIANATPFTFTTGHVLQTATRMPEVCH